AHSALHESVARDLGRRGGWVLAPEVSFSMYGERGAIDILAWHPARRALLVIELKTVLVDVQEVVATLDRKRRLAPRIAAERGWEAETVSPWLVLVDRSTNRHRVAAHRATLRAALPADGRVMRGWLRRPTGPIAALSLWPNSSGSNAGARVAGVQRATRARGGRDRA
ncbi:MAG TPA: hypothetical protein VFK38_00350, partial [Candidatus Limnocylindrales bacterium]|nr:hypothetical protein [Candidatus Limnocylindrales bacterium]